MGLLRGTRRALLDPGRKYYQKVKGAGPIAYWPQWELSGSASRCLVLPAQSGAYTGVTLGQPGIGDGRTSPFFDGANDFNNVFTPTFQGRFNGSEGTVMAWARVAQLPDDPWTDGLPRRIVTFRADINNRLNIQKAAANNTLRWHYMANGVVEQRNVVGFTTTDWFVMALTWDASAGINGEVRAYFNGVQQGATMVALGVWTGNLDATRTVVGAETTTPTQPWHGNEGHVAEWGRALLPAEILHLYNEAFR